MDGHEELKSSAKGSDGIADDMVVLSRLQGVKGGLPALGVATLVAPLLLCGDRIMEICSLIASSLSRSIMRSQLKLHMIEAERHSEWYDLRGRCYGLSVFDICFDEEVVTAGHRKFSCHGRR